MNDETKITDVTYEKPTEAPEPGFKWVRNLMSGTWIQIEENCPLCCDPSSETYWSM